VCINLFLVILSSFLRSTIFDLPSFALTSTSLYRLCTSPSISPIVHSSPGAYRYRNHTSYLTTLSFSSVLRTEDRVAQLPAESFPPPSHHATSTQSHHIIQPQNSSPLLCVLSVQTGRLIPALQWMHRLQLWPVDSELPLEPGDRLPCIEQRPIWLDSSTTRSFLSIQPETPESRSASPAMRSLRPSLQIL
jgi:hypothetical protein